MSPDRRRFFEKNASIIEKIHGFEDPSFRTYMGKRNLDLPFDEVVELALKMNDHSHPVVKYSGAWAVAELGIKRPSKKRTGRDNSLSFRLQALNAARKILQDTEPIFKKTRDAIVSPDHKADLLGFELRAEQALAYMPSLQLVAFLYSGQEVTELERDLLLGLTHKNLIELGKKGLAFSQKEIFTAKATGVSNEILSGLLLQRGNSKFVVVPASIRQDNNCNIQLRADLVAISTEYPHDKKLIQVSSTNDPSTEKGMRFAVQVPGDVTLSGLGSRDTLRELIECETHSNLSKTNEFDRLSKALADRLVAFTPSK